MAGASAGDTSAVRSKKIVLALGGGPSHFIGEPGVPRHLLTRIDPIGAAWSARIMWHPEHRLRIGFESGHVHLYSYSIEEPGVEGSVRLTGIPLLLQWSMPIGERFEVLAGYGTYRLTSELDYLGKVRSSFYSQGYAAAVACKLPLTDELGLAMELKWMNAFVTRHHMIALLFRLDIDLHEW